jgi:hypothetical protein
VILLISYDLNGHERPSSYARVKQHIERKATSSRRPLYSQWFVETDESPQAWSDSLANASLTDSNDRLFICQVKRPYQGLLAKDDWDWLSARL